MTGISRRANGRHGAPPERPSAAKGEYWTPGAGTARSEPPLLGGWREGGWAGREGLGRFEPGGEIIDCKSALNRGEQPFRRVCSFVNSKRSSSVVVFVCFDWPLPWTMVVGCERYRLDGQTTAGGEVPHRSPFCCDVSLHFPARPLIRALSPRKFKPMRHSAARAQASATPVLRRPRRALIACASEELSGGFGTDGGGRHVSRSRHAIAACPLRLHWAGSLPSSPALNQLQTEGLEHSRAFCAL
jgi:hypothetical protein